jgi:hypothetical protein
MLLSDIWTECPQRWTEFFGARGAVNITYCDGPQDLYEEMSKKSWLIPGTEEILISLWQSQVTRAKE